MCRVKLKDDIQTKQDVQNLITAIILRQRGQYNKMYLNAAVDYYLPTKRKVVTDREKIKMIDHTLAILRQNGVVSIFDGKYYTSTSAAICASAGQG